MVKINDEVGLTKCVDCGAELSSTSMVDTCPHCGGEFSNPTSFKFRLLKLNFYTVGAGIFFLAVFMLKSNDGPSLWYWIPFIFLTLMLIAMSSGVSYQKKRYGFDVRDYTSTVGAYFVYLPLWSVYVASIALPLEIHYKHGGFLSDILTVNLVFWFWLIGYWFFLKFIKAI